MNTTYTPQQRAGIAAAFRAAKPFLSDGKAAEIGLYRHICFALDETNHRHSLTARLVIRNRLGGNGSLCHWLLSQGVPIADIREPVRIQAYRHAWLDALIAEFSAIDTCGTKRA